MPQMYSLYYFLPGILFIAVIHSVTSSISKKIKGIVRVGPHNEDILSIIYGSLLGDAHAEKRISGAGTRISFYQEDSHYKYALFLHDLLSKAGYCNDKTPKLATRLGKKGKLRKTVRFHS